MMFTTSKIRSKDSPMKPCGASGARPGWSAIKSIMAHASIEGAQATAHGFAPLKLLIRNYRLLNNIPSAYFFTRSAPTNGCDDSSKMRQILAAIDEKQHS